MNYAIIEGTTVKSTGTLQQLFPNTSFNLSTPNADFLTANNTVELIEDLEYTPKTQKLVYVEPYVDNGKAYNVKVEPMTTEEQNQYISDEWFNVRLHRNDLLGLSDWRANSDVTLSDDWKTYRQALRDITTQSDPFNITWPKLPS